MKKVCFWFDNRKRKANIWNNVDSEFLHFDLIKDMPFDSEIKFLFPFDKIHDKDINIFLIELRYQHLPDFKKVVKRNLKDFLNKNSSFVIMFYLPSEAGFLGYGEEVMWNIGKYFDNLTNKKYFIYGALDVSKYAPTKFVDKTIGLDYFEYWTYRQQNTNLIADTRILKNFLCLNRRLTDSRIALLALLYKKNLYDTNYVSNLKVNYNAPGIPYFSNAKEFLLESDKKYADKMFELSPLTLDYTLNDYPIEYFPYMGESDYYEKTYFSLVTETCIDRLFLTEKVYKCIARGHPFIVWGSPFLLDYLKSKGYETYSSVFDESYDIEIDHQKRLYKIIESVEKFINLPSKEKVYKHKILRRIAEHNRTLFLERAEYNYKKQWQKVIEKISNDKKN